jgi:hypothetical protein
MYDKVVKGRISNGVGTSQPSGMKYFAGRILSIHIFEEHPNTNSNRL